MNNSPDIDDIADFIVGGGLKDAFDNDEVRNYCLRALADWGCKPPANKLLLFCCVKAGSPVLHGLLKAAGTNIRALLESHPKIARVFSAIARLCREERDKEKLKSHLMALMRGESPDPPSFDAATDLSIFQAMHTATALDDLKTLSLALDGVAAALKSLDRDVVGALLDQWSDGSTRSLAGRIKYNSNMHHFAGREAEIDLLDHFLGEAVGWSPHHAFRWLLLTADGGTGKTRLAMEYVRHHLPEGWAGGRLRIDDLPTVIASTPGWRPHAPTLLIIDYPAQRAASVHDLLMRFQQQAPHFDFAVRVLLLERNAEDSWYAQVFPESGDGSALHRHAFAPDGDTPPDRGISLSPPDWPAVLRTVSARLDAAVEQAAGDGEPVPIPMEAITSLCAFMIRVDPQPPTTDPDGETIPGPPRPLFVAATLEWALEAVKQGRALEDLLEDSQSRDALFQGILARDRSEFWNPLAEERRADLDAHENLLALASFALGLPEAMQIVKRAEALDIDGVLPRQPCADLLRRMTSLSDGRLAELQPDLLGEYHALARLEAIRRDHGAPMVARFCQLAYRLGNDEAGVFAARCLRDFASHLPELGWLAPADGGGDGDVAPFAGLCVDASAILPPATSLSLVDRLESLTRDESWSADARAIGRYGDALKNLGSKVGEDPLWEHLPTLLARLDALARRFPDSAPLALQEAQALYNLLTVVAEQAAWQHLPTLYERLDILTRRTPANEAVAMLEARALKNLASGMTEQPEDEARLPAVVDRFEALVRRFPGSEAIATEESKTLTNIARGIGQHRAWQHLPTFTARLDALASRFPGNETVATEEAQALFNIAKGIAEHQAWDHLALVTARLDTLARRFPDSELVANKEAKAVKNLTGGVGDHQLWERLPALISRLDILARRFPGAETIAIEEAQAVTNFASDVGQNRAWDHLAQLTGRLETLARRFPGSEAIAVPAAKAFKNLASGIGGHADWDHLPAIVAGFDALALRFPDHEPVAIEEAQALFNLLLEATTAAVWDQVPGLFARLDALAQRLPDSEPVATYEARALANMAQEVAAVPAWDHLPLVATRIEVLARRFPDAEPVAHAEAALLFNLASGIGSDRAWQHWPLIRDRLARLVARIDDPDRQVAPATAAAIAGAYVSHGFLLAGDGLRPDADDIELYAGQCLVCVATAEHAPAPPLPGIALMLIKYWGEQMPDEGAVQDARTMLIERMGIDFDEVPDMMADD